MRTEAKRTLSIRKTICISLVLLIISGLCMCVVGTNTSLQTVKIEFSNDTSINVLTSKTKVLEILKENNIILLEDEKVIPKMEEDITEAKKIIITKASDETKKISKIATAETTTSINQIIDEYAPIVEKIEVIQEEIPFETITKDVSDDAKDTTNKVIQNGKNGLRETTYRVRYKKEVEISREEISSTIIKEPVDKIVQINKKATVTSRSGVARTAGDGVYKITAYCACSKCCGRYASGYTSSGTKATAGRTIATSSKFAFGTEIKINGEVYIVEDRGGAIQGNKIDIYMDTHQEALQWGVRYLPIEVLN